MSVGLLFFSRKQSEPGKGLSNVEKAQKAAEICTPQVLAIMAAIMDSGSDLFMSERPLVSGNLAPNGCRYVICSFVYLFSASDLNSISLKRDTHLLTTLIVPTQHMWQSCPCLAPLSCPSPSHRALTLVSSSYTLLESQHLSRDGLTLLSGTL